VDYRGLDIAQFAVSGAGLGAVVEGDAARVTDGYFSRPALLRGSRMMPTELTR